MAVRLSGLVKNWSVVGGYGFIDGGRSEYFCHRSQLQNCFSLEPSDTVTFIAAPSEKKAGKMNAKEVCLVAGRAASERIVVGGGPSSSSTAPIKSKEATSRAALPSHARAPARSSGVKMTSTGVVSQTKRAPEAPQLAGKSAGTASSSSRDAAAPRQEAARATAPAKAAPSQGEGAVLPKPPREENRQGKAPSKAVSNQEKEEKVQEGQEKEKDKAGLKPAVATVQKEKKEEKCIEDDVKGDATTKTPCSEDLETMSATTRSLASAESIRDSDSESCGDELIKECFANVATSQQGAKATQAMSVAAKKSKRQASEVEVKESCTAVPATKPSVAEDVVVDCWEELLSPEPSPVHAHAEAPEDHISFALVERLLASEALPVPEEKEDAEVAEEDKELTVDSCEAPACPAEQKSAVIAPAEDPEEADADALGSQEDNAAVAAVQSWRSAHDWQDASGCAYHNVSRPWQPLGGGVDLRQTDWSTYGSMHQAAVGDYYSPIPQPPMMTAMMPVPAAPGFGCVAHQHPWALPALPVFYVDPRGGVHPLQQMMVPVAVPISSMNHPPAGAALPPRF